MAEQGAGLPEERNVFGDRGRTGEGRGKWIPVHNGCREVKPGETLFISMVCHDVHMPAVNKALKFPVSIRKLRQRQ